MFCRGTDVACYVSIAASFYIALSRYCIKLKLIVESSIIMNRKDTLKRNFKAFIWHAVFLSLAQKFMDVNTVIPTMLIQSGGTPVHLGILTAIMVGGNSFMGIFFASFLTHRERKRKYLITGINLRVSALLLMGVILAFAGMLSGGAIIASILILMMIFSFSGAFAGIAYNDILGRAIDLGSRKKFFIVKQTLASVGILASAILARQALKLLSYPRNYSVLFLIAGGLLLIATIGFWIIKEEAVEVKEDLSYRQRFKLLKEAFFRDKNLRSYLYLTNTVSLGFAIIPFLISFAKDNFGLTSADTGNFLLLQVSGMVVSTLIYRFVSRGQRYKGILTIFIIAGALLPSLALLFQGSRTLYFSLFFLSGVVLAARQISLPGILLEISTDENRAIYTGLSGLGSIGVLIYPVFAGIIIQSFGYTTIFIMTSILIVSSFYFSHKVRCTRFDGGEN